MRFEFSRRAFLASTPLVASALGSAEPASSAPLSAQHRPPTGSVPFSFDRESFQAILDRPFPHRQICAPSTYGAATVALSHFNNALAAYADPAGFAAGPQSLHCVAVLYGGNSQTLVLDDAMWAKYGIGLLNDEELRPNDTTYRDYWTALKRNPMAEFMQPLIDDRVVSFFVCNNALSSLAGQLAARSKPKGAEIAREDVVAIHDDLAAHFLPGTMLVPAGVAALNAAQESRFTFLP